MIEQKSTKVFKFYYHFLLLEIVHPSIRGSLVIITGIFMTIGQLISWILGYFLDWRTTAFVLMGPPLLLALLFIPFPETPYWLVENNKLNLAKKSLEFYRGNQYNVDGELFEISQNHESKLRNTSNDNTAQKLLSMTFFRPFSCVGFLYIIFTWTGHFTFQVYMIIILREIASSIGSDNGSKIDADITPIIIGVTGVLSACRSHCY